MSQANESSKERLDLPKWDAPGEKKERNLPPPPPKEKKTDSKKAESGTSKQPPTPPPPSSQKQSDNRKSKHIPSTSKQSNSKKKKKSKMPIVVGSIVVVILLLLLATAVVVVIFVSQADDSPKIEDVMDENGQFTDIIEDAPIKGVLFFDESQSGTRSSGGTNVGNLLLLGDEGKVETIDLDEKIPAGTQSPVSGEFEFDKDGEEWVLSSFKEILPEKDISDSKDILTHEGTPIILETSSIGICIYNRTFGFLMQDTPVPFYSDELVPTVFTDVKVTATPVGVDLIKLLKFLPSDITKDYQIFIDAFDANYKLEGTVMFVSEFEYTDPEVVQGDLLAQITPDDIVKASKLITGDIDNKYYQFILDVISEVDMELWVVTEDDNTLSDFDVWFILASSTYSKNELYGKLDITVSTIDFEKTQDEFGIMPKNDGGLDLHFAVCAPNSVKTHSFASSSVPQLWDNLDSPGRNVNVTCFSYIVSLKEIIEAIEKVSEQDLSDIKKFTALANPAVAFLLDQDIAEIFSRERPLNEYLGLAFIPNWQQDDTGIEFITLLGVEYSMKDFFGFDSFDFPIIICDNVTEGTAAERSLEDIYNNPPDQLFTYVSTEGNLMGTTLKSVAQFTKFIDPTGISQMVDQSPVDFGAYKLTYYASENDTKYHVPVGKFYVGKGMTCLSKYVEVEGFYINFEEGRNMIEEITGMTGFFGDGIISGFINDLLFNLGSNSVVMDGAIFALEINEIKQSYEFSFSNVEVIVVEDESCVVPMVTGKITNSGESAFVYLSVRLENDETGYSTFLKGKIRHSEDDSWLNWEEFHLSYGDEGYFSVANGTEYLDKGNYTVHIDVLKRFTFGYAEVLGSYDIPIIIEDNFKPLSGNDALSSGELIADGDMLIRSVGYCNDYVDYFKMDVENGDYILVEYYNIKDANVEITLLDQNGDSISTTHWSWGTVLSTTSTYDGSYYLKVDYDAPGVYGLVFAVKGDDGNNDFTTASEVFSGYIYSDGVSPSDTSDFYKIYLNGGDFVCVEYENVEGSNVEMFFYDSSQQLIADTNWDTTTRIYGSVNVSGYYYIEIRVDSGDGLYTLSVFRNEHKPLDISSGQVGTGSLYATDYHIYRIYATSGQYIDTTYNYGDVELYLYDPDGYFIDDTTWPSSHAEGAATVTGYYELYVQADDDTDYEISVSVS